MGGRTTGWLVAALALLAATPAAWAQCTSGTQAVPYCDAALTYVGCCDGDGLYWCENGVTCYIDCALNPFCGWNDNDEFYNCATNGAAEPTGTYPLSCPVDNDGDGSFFPNDCDDANAAVFPFAPEICDGILDNNCDGFDDASELDNDGDGLSECTGDCNDLDAAIFPGAPDECGDGIDSDCAGDFEWEYDADGDGYAPCSDDCDEGNPAINPGAEELCDDGLDNDCDGKADGYDGECAGGDDDDTSADDDTQAPLGSRAGPYGLRCAQDDAPSASTAALLIGLAIAGLLRRCR